MLVIGIYIPCKDLISKLAKRKIDVVNFSHPRWPVDELYQGCYANNVVDEGDDLR